MNTQAKNSTTRYHTEIRVNTDGVKFSQSKAFSNRTFSKIWLKKREFELETDFCTSIIAHL